jgi:polyhydroxybutyrate depolymerase
VVLYEKEIGVLATWKPVELSAASLPESALLELAGIDFVELRDGKWVATPRQLSDLAVAMLNDGTLDDRQSLSAETVNALRTATGPWHDLGDGFGTVLVTATPVSDATTSRIVGLARDIVSGKPIDPTRWQVAEPATGVPKSGKVPELPQQTLVVDGEERSYLLFVPSRGGDGPLPLLIMLHGGGRSGREELERTRWDLTAEREGFLVAFPDGGWNDGSGRGGTRDDVAFIAALIDEVAQHHAVDRGRVYLTGFALGASMSFRAGYELADRIAAIAPVTGHFMLEEPPPLDSPVSMICFIGTEDVANPMRKDVVRISGGTGIRKPYVRDSALNWVGVLGLPPHSTLVYAGDGLFEERFGPGPKGEEAILYIIEGMGFQWPGGVPLLPDRVGPGTDRIIANDVIWEFFARHGRESDFAKE